MTHTKDTLSSDSQQHRETNDCSVLAAAVVTGLSYDVVHAAMKGRGRRNGRGFIRVLWEKAINDLGFDCIDVSDQFRGRTMRTLCRELRRRPSTEKYLIHVRRHVAGWNGVELVDWTKGRLKRVEYILKVIPRNSAPSVVKSMRGTFKKTIVTKHPIENIAIEMRRTAFEVEAPRRVNRQKFIDERLTIFVDDTEGSQKMYYIELVGDAAVNERKHMNLRGKVYTIFGVE